MTCPNGWKLDCMSKAFRGGLQDIPEKGHAASAITILRELGKTGSDAHQDLARDLVEALKYHERTYLRIASEKRENQRLQKELQELERNMTGREKQELMEELKLEREGG